MRRSAKWALYVTAGVLTSAVIFLLVYGITTHTEPGLLCTTVPGVGAYEYSKPGCTPLMWDHMPLTVGESAGSDPELVAAIQAINRRLGFQALKYDPRNPTPDVLVRRVPVLNGVSISGAPHWILDGRHRVFLSATEGMMSHLVLQHELYHAIGLAHDPYRSSIMYGDDRGGHVWHANQRLSDSDRRLLRRLYKDQ